MENMIAMGRYICTHCGHRFESAPQDTMICPNCFWSTSVKSEEARTTSPTPQVSEPQVISGPSKLWFWTGGGASALTLLGVSVFIARNLQKQKEVIRTIESENAKVIASQAPELALLPVEREILDREVPLQPNIDLTESEKGILARQVPLHSRMIEGLASPPWNEKQFDAFIKAQEMQYRIPLGWSYRRKLVQLFRQHYVAATAAFEAKNFLQARDEWIRSLTFPIYQNDIKKHRGVVLTMLRPLVNDTLSKIGAMNARLTEKDSFGPEEKIRSDYQAFYNLLQAHSWEEANAKLLELQKELEKAGTAQTTVSPPPLPKETALIDSDIRDVLLTQVAPVQPGVRDWESLRGDFQEKEKIIKSRLPSTLEAVRKQYEDALTLIKAGNWREAKELLQRIDFPDALAEDAKAKIKILDKAAASLDSQRKTS